MKKILVLTAIAFGFAGMNAQQTKSESGIELIPRAGINISNQSIKNVSGEKSKVGFVGGIGVNIQTGVKSFSIQPEVNFISKGTKVKSNGITETYNFNYIEIPVLAKYSFGPLYVNAGPSIGFLTGKSDKVSKTHSVDFGIQMGAGLAIPAGPGKLIIDGRYNLGLNNISNEKGLSVKNRGVAITLGYAIPL
ncbi:hypothetical protein ATB99_14760 [Elizabethkingia meningoseptica]|uniref:porin family protein n=1 Tax=Elizabethkingia meningoseptica TaxID=238 RepID=UPI000332D108|nr:porin family protein [Elizabethkingia meningoseptica]AQX05818.1 hypothetical protein BBD33_11445 [Elizabethkingia meningoseptica]AQX47862.1 hypothetical protein B5G46_11435 [Elizabethkingia meningoseptica]EOR29942.1 hypothetical protein L100_08664 [Elizabethkingia meningoseptica ATCC 13253 = NBRC 12535]KUY23051.1 hypothetical protein ATB99_14760 [Elizabethkingia meningoseptica]OPB71200.1 hypothetical protein BAY30_01115 [Elizabethkingia meningoseptica]